MSVTKIAAKTSSHANFLLADWLVEPALNRISRADISVQLEPRVMDTLVYLTARAGELVSRDELLNQVWQGVVSEQSVNRNIAELRKALADDAQSPRFIETIPKRGYRLIAPVTAAPVTAAPVIAAPVRSGNGRRWRWAVGSVLFVVALIVGYKGWQAIEPTWNDRQQFSTIRALTQWPGEETDPAFSRDGNWLVLSNRAQYNDHSHLFLHQMATGTAIQLTSAAADDSSPSWSADGKRIAFARRNARHCQVMLLTLSDDRRSATEQELLPCGDDSYSRIIWGQNDHSIVFTDRDNFSTPYRVYSFDLDTGEKQQLTNPEINQDWDYERKGDYRGYGDYWLARAPDNSGFLFARNYYGQESDVFEMKWREKKPIEVFEWGYPISGFQYNASSDGLIYQDTASSIVEYRFGSGDRQTLWDAETNVHSPAPHPQGKGLAYVASDQRWQLWQRSLQHNTEAKPLASSASHDYFGQHAHRSGQIAFVSERSGQPELWLREPDGSERQLLRSPFWINHKPLRWSPDDTAIMVEVLNVILSVRVADGSVRQHTPVNTTGSTERWIASGPSWSHDGKAIYFASDRSGSWQIWRVSTDTAFEDVRERGFDLKRAVLKPDDLQQITEHGGYSVWASSDGNWLYYSKAHQHGLWRMPVRGGAEELVLPDLAANQPYYWQLTDHGVYFRITGTAEDGVYFYNFSNGSRERIAADLPGQGRQFSVSPNGETLLFNRREGHGSDIYLVQ